MIKVLRQKLSDVLLRKLVTYLDHAFFDGEGSAQLFQRLQMRLATSPMVFGGGWERVSLGNNVKLVNALLNVSSGCISIGDHSFFGHNVSLITGTHYVHEVGETRQEFPLSGRDIIIGRGVWIASNVVVLGPCSIGDNVVVGAGAVVTCGQLEQGWMYAGVPATKVKKILQQP